MIGLGEKAKLFPFSLFLSHYSPLALLACLGLRKALWSRQAFISLFVLVALNPLLGLSTEGNLRFKIDWASLTVGSKFTVFALFYFVFEGNFPSTSPWEAYIWRGDLT